MKCTSNSSGPVSGAKTFGELVRKWRKSARISQESISHAVGVTQASISRIETGDQDLGINLAYKLFQFLLSKSQIMDRSKPIKPKNCSHCGQLMTEELQATRRADAKCRQSKSQKAAIEKRRSKGLYIGRPPKNPYEESQVVDLRSNGNSYTIIARKLGISILTVGKICRKLGLNKVRTTTSVPRKIKPKQLIDTDGHRPWMGFQNEES